MREVTDTPEMEIGSWATTRGRSVTLFTLAEGYTTQRVSLQMMNDLVYDENSPSYFQPNLSDGYLDELDRLFDRICKSPNDREKVIETKIEEVEGRLPDHEPAKGSQQREEYIELQKYIGVLRVLHDIAEVRYHIKKDPDEIEGYPPVVVYPPDPDRFSDNPDKYKQIEQRILEKERRAQFDKSTREFIRTMENPSRHKGRRIDVTDLIVDGEEFYQDLHHLQDLERDEITEELDDLIQPYVQVAESGVTDPHTGYDLHDIWRYFRYTWRTPYNTVPGRNINFLIRDAARELHPVMGIASIASSMMNLKRRDQYLGWRLDSVEEGLKREKQVNMVEHQLPKEERTPDQQTVEKPVTNYLETEQEWEERSKKHCQFIRSAVENSIEESIQNIRHDDFLTRFDDLTERDFKKATETAFTRLKQLEGMGTYVFKGKPHILQEDEDSENFENVFDPSEFELRESDLRDLDIEDTDPDSYDKTTLDTIGVSKSDLEALVLADVDEERREYDHQEFEQRLQQAFPSDIELDTFSEVPIDLEATKLDSFGPLERKR
ncbi:Druantia anti-phage system protein DruA [Halobaculum litoreum]|uniref:Druantia anti-phage system protein DruA n=2 Tax=Halobaculum litoreum TaxID=3031998 RepID=A0ABD5XVU2_9EURY